VSVIYITYAEFPELMFIRRLEKRCRIHPAGGLGVGRIVGPCLSIPFKKLRRKGSPEGVLSAGGLGVSPSFKRIPQDWGIRGLTESISVVSKHINKALLYPSLRGAIATKQSHRRMIIHQPALRLFWNFVSRNDGG